MKYEELTILLSEISDHINELREDGIETVEKILKHLKRSEKNNIFDEEFKTFLIRKPLLVDACIKAIIKRVDEYTNQYDYDLIIYKLKNKKISSSDNLHIVFKKCLEFMINHNIIREKYDENYNPIEPIEPEDVENVDDLKVIEKQQPRCNQIEAYERLKKNGLETGIHCQATGCGKTNIILHYIDYTVKKFKDKTKIILFTERVNILRDLFDFSKKGNEPNNHNILKWKKQGIADLEDVNFINRVTIKKLKWMDTLISAKKATVLVINRAYLTSDAKQYDKMKATISLVLHDECHNTSSERCNEFLVRCKSYDIPIVGFSATPLRTGKNDKSKLLEIYGDENNLLKLLTNYNMIYAIQQDLILPPEFYWYHVEIKSLKDLKTENDKRQYELGTVFEILNTIIPKLPNKKIVAWCGRIDLAEKWKQLFIDNHKQKAPLHGFKFYLDTSKNGDEDYMEFRKSEGQCILFCANKHREGSDIIKLDACMFLDGVIKRGCIPFIQSIGRVLRKESNPESNKTRGFVIDGIYKYEDYEKDFIDKIIGYYTSLQNISDEIDTDTSQTNYEKYIKLRDIIKFDPDNEMIYLNFNNKEISINVNKLHWDDIISKFDNILQRKIKLSEPDKVLADFNNLKLIVKNADIKSLYEYQNIYKELKIIEKPDIEYSAFWKGWYDFLNIDISNYPRTLEELKIKIEKLNIRTIKEYLRKALILNLPLMPEELYKDYINFNDLLIFH